MRKLSLIVVPSFIFLFGHASDFISFLFTAKYVDSVTIFRIYLCLVPLHMFILSPIPQVFGRTRITLNIVLVTSTFHLLFSYLLLKTIGFYGPGISAVVTQWLQSILFLAVGLHLTRATPAMFLPLGALARVIGSSVIALMVSWTPGLFTDSPATRFIAGALLFSVCWLLSSLLMGVFTAEDRALARRSLFRLRNLLP